MSQQGIDNVPHDQANRLRQLVRARTEDQPGTRTHMIAVTSGKGGVGKTMTATNLSIALSTRGYRVVVFDMDMGLANADILFGVQPKGTWREVLQGKRSIDDIIAKVPGDVSLVPGPSGVTRMADLSEFERHQLRAAMQVLEARHDVAIMDCGAGISRNVLEFAAIADTVLVVATPEPTAMTDAYAMIKAFAQEERFRRGRAASVGTIVNQAASRREGRDTYDRLAGVAARFLHIPVTDYGYILRDDHVPAAVRERRPIVLRYPRCSASCCLMAAAGRIAKELGQQEARQGLFYRVMKMFI